MTSFKYRYHVVLWDSPNIDKIIRIHQEMSAELGSDEPLPLEGGLFRLQFSSTDHDHFFYGWAFEAAMEDGCIEILRDEEVISRINFWDCFCVGVEEWMSAGGAPMGIELLISPGIMKNGDLMFEKIWKVSDIHGDAEAMKARREPKEEKVPEITAVYWKDAKGNYRVDNLPEDEVVTLYAEAKNTNPGDRLSFTITADDGSLLAKIENCEVDGMGIAKIVNFNLKEYRNEKKN